MTDRFPKLILGLAGGMSVAEAPDEAEFPLAWLLGLERSKGYIEAKANIVTFLPTDEDAIRYRITGYNVDTKRFTGVRVNE